MKTPVTLVLIALSLIQIVFVYSPEPILLIWPDSISYLGPAADAIDSGRLTNWNTASGGFLYPLMVWGMLAIAPEPWPIVLVQRLMVLATFVTLAVSMWWLWRASAAGLTSSASEAGLRSSASEAGLKSCPTLRSPISAATLIAFWLLAYVLYPPVIGLGQSLMPEVLFSFVLALVLAGLVAVAAPSVSRSISAVASWATPFASVALAFIKPHWVLAAVAVPLVLPWIAPRANRRLLIRRSAISFALAMLVIVLPEGLWQEREGARFNRVFGPRSLFCNSADLIYEYLAPRTADPFAREVAQTLKPILTDEARAKARVLDWNLLDFEGDQCTHGATAEVVQQHHVGQLGAEIRYYLATYLTALAAHPSYVVRRLWRQLGAVAFRPFNAVQAAVFQTSGYFPALRDARDKHALFAQWHETYRREFGRTIVLPTHNWRFPLRVFFALAGFGVGATSLLAFSAIAIARRRRVPATEVERALLAILVCALALNTLIALVHTFDLPRYSAMQTPLFALLGYAASLTLMSQGLGRYTSRGRALLCGLVCLCDWRLLGRVPGVSGA